MTLVRLEPAAPWSQVKHSISEPLHSLFYQQMTKVAIWKELKIDLMKNFTNVVPLSCGCDLIDVSYFQGSAKGANIVLLETGGDR